MEPHRAFACPLSQLLVILTLALPVAPDPTAPVKTEFEAMIVSGAPIVRSVSGAQSKGASGQTVAVGATLLVPPSGVVVLRVGESSFLRLAPGSELELNSDFEVTLSAGGLLVRSNRELIVHAPPVDARATGIAHVSKNSDSVRISVIDGRVSAEGYGLRTVFGGHPGEAQISLPTPFWAETGQQSLAGIVAEQNSEQFVLADSQQRVPVRLEKGETSPRRGALVESSLLSIEALKVLGRLPGVEVPPILLLSVLGGPALLIDAFPHGI